MVKTTPKIPQLHLLTPCSKLMKKKHSKTTSKRRPKSTPLSSSFTHYETDSPVSKRIRQTTNEDVIPTPSKIHMSPTLEGYLPPPLPPPPSPELLRRTISNSAASLSNCTRISNKEKKEKLLSEEWIMVKCECECGIDCSFVVNKSGNKCRRLF
ncbi:hypothetical protein vseg_011156 [Gypsophila vaccaria]